MIDMPPEPPPAPEQIIEQRLVECGLNAKGISVKYDDELQSIEVIIAPSAGATSEHFPCIKEAAGYEIVNFEDGEAFAAYNEFLSELARPEMLDMYEGRLREAGLWEGFPDPHDFASLESYAVALEAHAGLEPGTALRVSGEGILFDPARNVSDYEDFVGRYSILLLVASYASTRDRFSFGFLGNEGVSE